MLMPLNPKIPRVFPQNPKIPTTHLSQNFKLTADHDISQTSKFVTL